MMYFGANILMWAIKPVIYHLLLMYKCNSYVEVNHCLKDDIMLANLLLMWGKGGSPFNN